MAETPPLERLTASDLFLLMWDDYGWSSDIGGLAVLDGASLLDHGGRVRIDAVREQLEPRLNLVPRFRQLLYRPRIGLGPAAAPPDLGMRPVAGLGRRERPLSGSGYGRRGPG